MFSLTRLNWKIPLLLFAVTCFTTTFCRIEFGNDTLYTLLLSLCLSLVGAEAAAQHWILFKHHLWDAFLFSAALMSILTCHELGHYFQSRRYRLESSLPYFLPMPFGPFGTFGAVIVMSDDVPSSRALFDIGITGPLAGLLPTLVCLYYGIQWSFLGPRQFSELEFGDPLIFQWMVYWTFGHIPPDMILYWHPFAFAAWVGVFLTALNLMPFGQLDGGHVLYAMLGRRSIPIVYCLFIAALITVALLALWHWSVILVLIILMGVTHPPTENDALPLGLHRHILGWATLLFVFAGFIPTPLNPDYYDPDRTPVWYGQSDNGQTDNFQADIRPIDALSAETSRLKTSCEWTSSAHSPKNAVPLPLIWTAKQPNDDKCSRTESNRGQILLAGASSRLKRHLPIAVTSPLVNAAINSFGLRNCLSCNGIHSA